MSGVLTPEQPTTRAIALTYCQSEIEFYDRVSGTNYKRWRVWQITAVVAGAVGTVLAGIEISALTKAYPDLAWLTWAAPIIRSIPVALATIAAGLNSSFAYQRDMVRQGATADSLKGERAKFETRTSPYNAPDEQTNVDSLMQAVRRIIDAEQGAWRSHAETNR